MKYTFWYKKEIEAKSLDKAVKLEKKAKLEMTSVQREDEDSNKQLTSAIGFAVETHGEEE